MINTNTVNLTHNLPLNPSKIQRNRSGGGAQGSGIRDSSFSGQHSRRDRSDFNNPSSFLLVLQLIMRLLDQLRGNQDNQTKPVKNPPVENPPVSKPPEDPVQTPPNTTPPENPGSSTENLIRGTSASDSLTGTRGDDRMLGLAGNDQIKGRAGDDFLFGGQGRDRIYGGKGNDTLSGGAGNDYLSGGRGSNRLFGGTGNDTLVSNRRGGVGGGTDRLDGGTGHDTARIRGHIDDFDIKVATIFPEGINPGDPVVQGAPSDNGFILTDKKTGKTINAVNIEIFRFNDIQLSSDELKERLTDTGQPQTVPLTEEQQAEALNLFGFIASGNEKVSIQDQDGDGEISVGDIATLNSSSSNPPGVVLTEANVRQITDRPTGERLKLDDRQQQQALDLFNAPQERSRNHVISVYDSNGDGKVSQGDLAIHTVTPSLVPAVEGYHSPVTEVERKTLTETEATQINGVADQDPELNLSPEQHDAIALHFDDTSALAFDGLATKYTGTAIDKDGNGQLSAGDVVKLQRFGGLVNTDFVEDHVLTAAEVEAINNSEGSQKLSLSPQQSNAISDRFNRTPPPNSADFLSVRFTGTAIDNNNDGKLSVGDVVKLRETGGIAGLDRIRDHVLTAGDIAAINDSDTDDGVVRGGGVSVGGTLGNRDTIPNDRIVDINGKNYSVGFLKQQVDDFANSSFVPKGAVDAAFGIHKWGTSNSIAAGVAFEKYIATTFPQGEPGLTGPEALKLTQEQQDAIGARFNRKPPPNLFDAPTITYTGETFDKDGNGKLSVGDVVKLRSLGGFTLPGNQDITRDHILTADDIAFIESDRSNPLLDISKGLSNEQRERLRGAINLDSPAKTPANNNVSIQSVFDANSDGKLSVGDSIVIQRSFGPSRDVDSGALRASGGMGGTEAIGASLSFHTLTQNELDRYLKGSDSSSQAQIDFEANKSKWQRSQPQDYSFTLGRSGFIGGDARKPVDITVSGNTVTDAKFADGSAGTVPDFNQLSIDDLFNTIGNAIDNNAVEVRVSYNAETGFPESIFIDQDRRLADEELFLAVSNFKDLGSQSGQFLDLTSRQQTSVENVFNIRNADVQDNDGNGRISEGDTVTGTLFRETGTINVNFQVSSDNANHINGTFGNELLLSTRQSAAISRELNLNNDLEGIRGVFDRDGNGRLSAGDVVYTRSNLNTTGGDPIGGSPKYYHLTAENIDAINTKFLKFRSSNSPGLAR